jgi:putative transposase
MIMDSLERLRWFECQLLSKLEELNAPCAAWCVLPNHYHCLVRIADIKAFGLGIGQLHGGTSYQMNKEDGRQGRQVWYSFQDRCMRSEAHFYTSINYIHKNPVKHGYVDKWQGWPFSSVHMYLERMGRDWLLDLWLRHPVLDYGKGWDD